MKKPFGIALAGAALLSTLVSSMAWSQDYRHGQDYRRDAAPSAYAPPAVYQDNARVTRVAPRYEQVQTPQEECRMEVEQVQAPPPQRNLGGMVIGGIAGGILGNQVGGGNGRAAATAIGAVGGALVGDNVANNANGGAVPSGPIERQVRRCNVVNRLVERSAGYEVSYQYNGRNYSTVLPQDPGPTLRVNVSVTPAY